MNPYYVVCMYTAVYQIGHSGTDWCGDPTDRSAE